MQPDEVRFLFAYDRWATRKVLAVLDGLDPAVWERTRRRCSPPRADRPASST